MFPLSAERFRGRRRWRAVGSRVHPQGCLMTCGPTRSRPGPAPASRSFPLRGHVASDTDGAAQELRERNSGATVSWDLVAPPPGGWDCSNPASASMTVVPSRHDARSRGVLDPAWPPRQERGVGGPRQCQQRRDLKRGDWSRRCLQQERMRHRCPRPGGRSGRSEATHPLNDFSVAQPGSVTASGEPLPWRAGPSRLWSNDAVIHGRPRGTRPNGAVAGG
jgi:hypothetical protein